MPDRIEVNVIEMASEVRFVAYRVFPVTALPYAPFTFVQAARRGSRDGNARENVALISRQRSAKSNTSSGRVQIAWRWSGSTTIASIANA